MLKNIDEIRITIGNAVKSLYQMIMVVDAQACECCVVDHNRELHNISGDITSFDSFCKELYKNIHPEDHDFDLSAGGWGL